MNHDQYPAHTFTAPGTYTVSLIARAGNSTDTVSQTITIVGIDDATSNQTINVFPNPANEVLFIETASEGTFVLNDLLGREVIRIYLSPGTNKIEIKSANGLLLWQFIDAEAGVVAGKVLVE